ncbi:MAG: hypothetical protein ACFHX7_04640 [Pseudomonadota bacterium]
MKMLAGAFVLFLAWQFMTKSTAVEMPPPAAVVGAGIERVTTTEFMDLFEQSKPTSSLVVAGHYTVVEGYIDSCGICRVLEAKFPAFLDERPDLVIRRVRFPESASFSFSSQAEIDDHVRRMALYRSNHVQIDGERVSFRTCGTPHVEIYGPDGEIIAADLCGEANDKSGLSFLNHWISAEI